MKTTVRTLFILSLVVFMASCGTKTASTAVITKEEVAIKIGTATAILQDVAQTETYPTTVQANVVNNIAPQSGSRIQKINVEIGDFVSEGQILAEMDRLSLEQAKLSLVNDSTEFSRVKSLYEEGGVSKSDYEAQELLYNVSRTTYNNILENTILRAPVSGVISARNYDQGDMYLSASPIYVLEQITPVKLLVGITEKDYTKVKKGDTVTITCDALPGESFTGRINRVYPTFDETSHNFTCEVTVPNADRKLRPGMYAKVVVSFGDNHSIVIPDEAISKQQGSGQKIVYVLQDDDTVKAVFVTLGRHFGTSYEVLSGLEEGDIVATQGSSSLKDGSKVKVLN